MSEQQDLGPTLAPAAAAPPTRSRWWTVLLVTSLAFNLLIGGAIATRMLRGDGGSRFNGASFIQLLPGRFVGELPRDRRRVVTDILNRYRKMIRDQRDVSKATALELADAVAATPYDQDKVKAVIQKFSQQAGQLALTGGDATLEVLSQLTNEERQALATAIRERGVASERRSRN
jgi:hypothetical protein